VLEEDDSDTEGEGLCSRSFKPLYLMSIWKEPTTMAKGETVSIVLPSGLGPGTLQSAL